MSLDRTTRLGGFPIFDKLIKLIIGKMVTANTGFGSVWNKGSWHWENRNYTEFAKDWLSKNWCAIRLPVADAIIEIYEVKEVEGNANVSIRKQK